MPHSRSNRGINDDHPSVDGCDRTASSDENCDHIILMTVPRIILGVELKNLNLLMTGVIIIVQLVALSHCVTAK
jgi:hypothetical protein